MALRAKAHELRVFREELATLPAEVQDVHLSWIFHRSPAEAKAQAKAKAPLPKRRRALWSSRHSPTPRIGSNGTF